MQTLEQPKISHAIEAIFQVLGTPETDFQHFILEDYENGNQNTVKTTAAIQLHDYYCKCLGFLIAIKPDSPNLPTLLSAAATAAADHHQHSVLRMLNEGLATAFTSDDAPGTAINVVLSFLKPVNDIHQQALAAFNDLDYATVKKMAAIHLNEPFCKALGYLTSATKPSPALPTIVAEAARAAAEHCRVVALQVLSEAIAQALA